MGQVAESQATTGCTLLRHSRCGAVGPGHEEEGWVMKLAAFVDEKGTGLLETLVALAIVSVILTAFLAALSIGTFGVSVVRERVTAENLARAQLEAIKDAPYITGALPISYTSQYTVTTPPAYHIGVDVSYWLSPIFTTEPSDDPDCCGMQWITVTVSHNGEPVFRAIDYKLNR